MKTSTYPNAGIPSNCGVDYTIWRMICALFFVSALKYTKFYIGTVFGLIRVSYKENHGTQEVSLRKGGSGFDKRTDLELDQTIRHGFILYIVVALLTVPTGISAYQHQRFEYAPPLISRGLAPVELYEEIASPSFTMAAEALDHAIVQADIEAALAALPPYFLPIMKASEEHQVDAALIRAIIMAESSNNPSAVSHRGAQGLMQLMPTTARSLGVTDAFDPELNIDGGVRYLKSLLNRFNGNVKLALAAYNAGSRYVRKYGGVPPFKATRLYIKKVLQYRQIYQNETAVIPSILSAV